VVESLRYRTRLSGEMRGMSNILTRDDDGTALTDYSMNGASVVISDLPSYSGY
jgi:hypothetical protein